MTTWIFIELFDLALIATIAGLWLRARRQGLSRQQAAKYRNALWLLVGWAALSAARLASLRHK
jgi:hypothetical protein